MKINYDVHFRLRYGQYTVPFFSSFLFVPERYFIIYFDRHICKRKRTPALYHNFLNLFGSDY